MQHVLQVHPPELSAAHDLLEREPNIYRERLPPVDLDAAAHGAVAQFERAILLERQREGIALAKARGAYKGRKPSLTPEQVVQLRQRALAGEKKAALAREFKVSRETLYAYLRGSMAQASE